MKHPPILTAHSDVLSDHVGSAYVTGCMNLPIHKLSKHLYAGTFTSLVFKILQPGALDSERFSSNLGFCLCFSANFANVRSLRFSREATLDLEDELWRTLHLSHSHDSAVTLTEFEFSDIEQR